jgi:hypothetical protein
VATREIPKELCEEIKSYIMLNKHMLDDGKLFRFDQNNLRRYLSTLRMRARKGQIDDKLLSEALLDTEGYSVAFGTQVTKAFRITLHSFRRFYESYKHHCEFDRDMAMLVRHMGYREKRTAYTYLYYPEHIGVSKLSNGMTLGKALYGKT